MATFSVVAIHSNTGRWAAGPADVPEIVMDVIVRICTYAVPLFFFISGFLFVGSYGKYGWLRLMANKARSLYVPAVVWIAIGWVACIPIRIYSNNMQSIWSFLSIPLLRLNTYESLHFWYVRALIAFAVISPIVYLLCRHRILVVLLLLLDACVPLDSYFVALHLNVAVFFYVLGATIAMHYSSTLYSFRYWVSCNKGLSMLLVFGLIALAALFNYRQQTCDHEVWYPLCMIMAMWIGYDVVFSNKTSTDFPHYFNVLFGVYCMHLILINWMGGCIRVVLGSSQLARILGYIMSLSSFALGLWLSNELRKRWPRTWAFLSGGR